MNDLIGIYKLVLKYKDKPVLIPGLQHNHYGVAIWTGERLHATRVYMLSPTSTRRTWVWDLTL